MIITNTERLVIEEATAEDAPFFYRLLNSRGWLTYIGDRNIYSEEAAVGYINNILVKSYADNGFGLYKIILKEDSQSVGICGFVKRDYLSHPDLGFAILPEYEGKGYVYEAAKKILEYGFATLGFQNVYAVTLTENTRSQNLLRNLCFEYTGTIQPDSNKAATLLFSLSANHSF